ncbi:MAG: M67 family metallopeptidase [Chloroflexi bacterium]|nr:M67 family metallopeptidase [Chloroflexota bacterium]
MEPVRVPKNIYEAMVAHAREGFPNEVCGVILGPPWEMREAHRAANAAADPLYTYDMSPQDLFRLNRLAEDTGWEFVAIYHSHPPFAAIYPSATDIAKAFYPDAVYFILAIGQTPLGDREGLRDRQRRADWQSQLGDPRALAPRIRAYRILKDDLFGHEGRVEELQIEIV